jgi:predicted O-linked N-acetylglucosamine transferase (SPINDLY family)
MSESESRQRLGAAISLHQAGRFVEAGVTYREILKQHPDNAVALHYLGALEAGLGHFKEACSLMARSLEIQPSNIQFSENYATLLYQSGDYNSALKTCDSGLRLNSANVALLYTSAIALYKLKRLDESLSQFDKLLSLQPEHLIAINERGSILAEMGRYDAASAAFQKVLTFEPRYAEAHLNCGNLFGKLRRFDEALAAYDQALVLKPELADAWLGRGNVFTELKRYNEAFKAYDKALALKPDLVAETWLGRGNVFSGLKRFDEAFAAYDKALALRPGLAEVWLGRGLIFRELDRRDEALAAFERALSLKPDSAEAWQGRGSVLLDMGRLSEALAAFDKALALTPDDADALSNRIFALDFADAGFAEQQAARRAWWEKVGAPIARQSGAVRHGNSRDAGRRLRVGYVSADLRDHSAAFCFRPMLQHHDRGAFEITCYSCSPVEDEVTADCRRAAEHWRNVAQASDAELYGQIVADGIDILVDLSGHTAGHRLAVFARRPAPVQVSAGATGTGLPVIDYLFSDPVACPASVRPLFAEKVYDLPSIMTIEPVPAGLRVTQAPVLSRGHVTFGVFNRAGKITDAAVEVWSRILHAVAGSRLLLKDTAFDEAGLRGRQLERFAAHGIAAERIACLGRTPRVEHLAAFGQVDISLDPFPQNGGISALESMQMGVPVIALLGEGVSSRAAGAILCSIGMHDWVAQTREDYLAIARKFAAMPEHLAALRTALPQRIATAAVGNAAIYTKAIETAYQTFWNEYCRA